MPIANETFTRREALASLGAGAALLTLPARAVAQAASSDGTALLDDIAWNLLEHSPSTATTLGVDTGAKAYLRSRLAGTAPRDLTALAQTLRDDLARAQGVRHVALDASTRTSFEVVESAYSTALDGFALPYGDVAVGGWRNTPYVVIQNVGGYIDYPRFLDAEHPINQADDAEAYIARLSQVPAALEGELERISGGAALGLIPPRFLLAKAIPQMEASLADAKAGGRWSNRSPGAPPRRHRGDWEARAKPVVTGPIAAALERQLAELRRQATLAD
jgi:uncharacterized protein (DUF885 family)